MLLFWAQPWGSKAGAGGSEGLPAEGVKPNSPPRARDGEGSVPRSCCKIGILPLGDAESFCCLLAFGQPAMRIKASSASESLFATGTSAHEAVALMRLERSTNAILYFHTMQGMANLRECNCC